MKCCGAGRRAPIRASGWLLVVCALLGVAHVTPASGLLQNDIRKLAFTQLGAQSAEYSGSRVDEPRELFRVEVQINIQEMKASEGLTMVFDNKHQWLRLDPGILQDAGLAWGRYSDAIDTTGWSELYITTASSAQVSNDVTMYSAGFIEGMLTCVRISEFNANTRQLLLIKDSKAHALGHIRKLFRSQLQYMMKKVNADRQNLLAEEPSDPYWKHVRYILFQLWGLCDGYNKVARLYQVHELDLEDLILLNAAGELPQLMEAYNPEAISRRASANPLLLQRGARRKRTARRAEVSGGENSGAANATSAGDPLDDEHWERRVAGDGHCSALVRLTPGNKDILLGHTTWDDYSKMTRIFKYYNFALNGADTVSKQVAFSSYPGLVSSTDDFYIMDSGIAVMETSIIVLNPAVWDKLVDVTVKPRIPNFAHLMAVNRLAKSAPHWAQLFKTLSADTYTSQWMVVDYNQFASGSSPGDDTFWVVEAIPGASHAEDMTPFLRSHAYFPSFNRPFFSSVRELSGHAAAEVGYPELYSWAGNPRAEIFASKAASTDAPSIMRLLMTENLYPNSGRPPALAGPGHEISARMDLLPLGSASPNGGIDAKVTSRCLQKALQVQAISGPSHELLPPFRWLEAKGTEAWPGWPHIGLPSVWDFSWVQMSPAGQVSLGPDETEC